MEKYIGDYKVYQVHHNLFPSNVRMLIVGSSGCGKTCLLMRMLLEEGLLNYKKLYVFARSLYQYQYQALKAGIENNLKKSNIITLLNNNRYAEKNNVSIEDIAEALKDINDENDVESNDIECEFHESAENIPDPKDLEKTIRNLIIFDDIMDLKKQTTPSAYYTRGRSANCDSIYLAQNYTELPFHTVRDNANFMIFFKSSPHVVRQLYDKFSSEDMDLNTWKQFCKDAWDKDFGFIVIDLSRKFKSGNKYRKQLELNN